MSSSKRWNCNFQGRWLSDSKFVSWLKMSKMHHLLYMKTFLIAKHLVKAFGLPASGSEHKPWVPVDSQTSLRFANKEAKALIKVKAVNQQSTSQQSSNHSSIKEYSVNKVVTDAKISWFLDVILNCYSRNSFNNKKSLFTHMFRTVKEANH